MPSIILLTDDAANRRKAKEEGVLALSGLSSPSTDKLRLMHTTTVREYISSHPSRETLEELLASHGDEDQADESEGGKMDVDSQRDTRKAKTTFYPEV